MQTLRRKLIILIVPAMACLVVACEGMGAPTQPPPPAAALSTGIPSIPECLDDEDDDGDGLPTARELLLGLLANDADSDDDGILDGNDDANGNGRDDEDEDDDDDCPDRDSDGDGEDDEDEDDGGSGTPL
jgi:hypothetical protein